ncbi:hypothetical protein GC209_19675 [bacterium]|nr:hypothetical protein [bacterium]
MRTLIRSLLAACLAVALCLFAVTTTRAQTTATPPAPDAGAGAATGIVAGAAPILTSHTDVSVGAYVMRISNVSPQNGTFDVDMWLWFRWKGSDLRPDQTFELVNGVISSRSDAQLQDDEGVNYSTIRVQATMFHDFDVRRFPLDNHILTLELEDSNYDNAQLTYKVDEGIALDPSVKVSGWKVSMMPTTEATHVYNTNYGLRSAGADASNYSRLTFSVALERTSYGPLFKSFWISALAVLLGLLAFLIKADDLDARFGMGVGSIFAASANAFVITGELPPTTAVTLAEQINLIAVGVIFVSVFMSVFSLRLRYQDREEASLRLDMTAMWTLAVIYLVLNVLALTFDFSGGNG